MNIPHTEVEVRRFPSAVKPLRVWRWHDIIWGTDGKVLFTSWARMKWVNAEHYTMNIGDGKEAITAAHRLGLVPLAKLREYEKIYWAQAKRDLKRSRIRYLMEHAVSELREALRLKRKEGKA